MTGLDKIRKQIEDDASSHAEAVIAKANEEAQRILSNARKEGELKSLEIQEKSESDMAVCLRQGESAALLQEKKIILTAKQQIIENTISRARDTLRKLSEEEYFNIIFEMVKKYASPQSGEILFSAADKNRLPKQFEIRIKEALSDKEGASLRLSEDTRDLNGGFILIYGDIEENCSFDALFSASKEALQDKVYTIFFD